MTTTPKQTRVRLANDKELLKKIVKILEKEALTKEQLAEKLFIDDPKKFNDSCLLAAVKLAGNSNFLNNLIEKKAGGGVRKDPKYVIKTGLHIQHWQFDGRDVAEGQRYAVQFGKNGIITLRPVAEEKA
jgi:hypothetical protein